MCAAVCFDAGFDPDWIFLLDFLPKIVKKFVSSAFVDSSKNFLSGCRKKLLGRREAHWIA